MKIIDNFLNKEEYNNIVNIIADKEFPWYVSDMSDYPDDDNTQLYHVLYNNNIPYSDYFKDFQIFYDKLEMFYLFKVRAIATLQKRNDEKSNIYHTDIENVGILDTCTTAIYYLNSNDGGTQFEKDDSIVESVSNRMVIFNSTMKHRTVKHTKGDCFRYVLNFNYVGIKNDN